MASFARGAEWSRIGRGGGVPSFTPAALFSAGEVGAWYDPSDLTTLFQDTTGTLPVTTPGQSVALMLDKSGRGNHATQGTALSRPTYAIEPMTGRRNLLTFTEQFENSGWQKQNFGFISASVAPAPNDTLTADKLILTNTQSSTPQLAQNFSAVSGQQYALQLCAKAAEISDIVLIGGGAASGAGVRVNLLTGNIVQTFSAGALVSSSTISLGNGWWRIRIVVTANATGTGTLLVRATNTAGGAFLGNGVDGILIWGAQLELGATATAYQRVTTQFDVTEAGVASKSYLFFDGSDDGMQTGTITPGVDKAQVFAGVRKLNDVGSIVAELSNNAGGNTGSFYLVSGEDLSSRYSSMGRGTLAGTGVVALWTAGGTAVDTAVITATHDIPGDLSTIRRNGVLGTNGTADKGSGNFLAYPLYIGRRGGTTLPFNGNIYGLIVRFSATNLDAASITSTETWLNQRTGAY